MAIRYQTNPFNLPFLDKNKPGEVGTYVEWLQSMKGLHGNDLRSQCRRLPEKSPEFEGYKQFVRDNKLTFEEAGKAFEFKSSPPVTEIENLTFDNFHDRILRRPRAALEQWEKHLRDLWHAGANDRIYQITGISLTSQDTPSWNRKK